MTVPSNTLQTFAATSNAEDVQGDAYNLSPYDTPFMTMCKKEEAEATKTEWLTDALDAADTSNANVEGDDATVDASTTPVRLSNRCQLSDKVISVSTTQRAVHAYGMSDAFLYSQAKKMRGLKIDQESIMLANQAPVTGDATTAPKLRGLPSWLTTNVSRGGSGANGSATTAATDGTQRAFTETLFKTVIASIALNSGQFPTMVMAGVSNRSNLSSQLTGNSTRFTNMKDGVLNASITVYDSDFGPLKLILNRFMRQRDMFFINPKYMAMRVLEPMRMRPLATTGLSDKAQLWVNYTLAPKNELAHGVLADLLTAVL